MEKMGKAEPQSAYIVETTVEQLKVLFDKVEHALATARHGQDVLVPITDKIQFYVKGTVSLQSYGEARQTLVKRAEEYRKNVTHVSDSPSLPLHTVSSEEHSTVQ